jgi:hypothetical protein
LGKYKFASTITLFIGLVVIATIMAGVASVYSLHRVINNNEVLVSFHFKNMLEMRTEKSGAPPAITS